MQLPVGYERFAYQALVESIATSVVVVAFLAWGISLVNAALKRRQQMQMQKHLLEKFTSAHDFAEFLQSPAGQKYVLSLSEQGGSPRSSILNSVRLGIVLLLAGPALCISAIQAREVSHFIWGAGLVITMLGVGFLVSAVVCYRIAKKIKTEPSE